MMQLDLIGLRKRCKRLNDLVGGFRMEYFNTGREGSPELTAEELAEYRAALSDLIRAGERAQHALLCACLRHPPEVMPITRISGIVPSGEP